MRAIVDTGFLVAFANSDDAHHKWAFDLAPQLQLPALTCESVLSEAAFHLRDSDYVLELVATGLVVPEFSVADNLAELRKLAIVYRDRVPDFADLCLIRMSEIHPRHVVITTDKSDFQVYRRNKREVIPIQCPP